ncbi:MAG: DUF1638 domain-containing protein [Acidimicrobiaceae bacterium]|nr:DUF1638 domain-containing protein [Acidimicrobiaceae bacterium]
MIDSSINSLSVSDGRVLDIIACGAIASSVREIAKRRGWSVEIHALSALLHDRPEKIANEVEGIASRLISEGKWVAVAYADCGTYGEIDRVCSDLGIGRLSGLHCYDVFAGKTMIEKIFDSEPGTYLLTDFLVRSFNKTVVKELGLDRFPELVWDYFGQYKRVLWLKQGSDPSLDAKAEEVAELLGLPLEVFETTDSGLEYELEKLYCNNYADGGTVKDTEMSLTAGSTW